MDEEEFLGSPEHRAYLRSRGLIGPDGRLNEAGRAYKARQDTERGGDTEEARREREDWTSEIRARAEDNTHPVLDWAFGSGGREDRARAGNAIEHLGDDAPTADELSPEYGLLPESEAGAAHSDPRFNEAQLRALGQLEQWGRGEMTSADFGRRDLLRNALAQDERQQREGVTRRMAERGLGGSGLETLGLLTSQQGMADRLSAADTAMNVAVQDRALRSIEQAGQMAGAGRGQSFDESYQRGNAIDRFNAGNTEIKNRQADEAARARQQEYQNRENQTAMATGQYNRNASAADSERDRQRGAAGEVLDWAGGLFNFDEDDEEESGGFDSGGGFGNPYG